MSAATSTAAAVVRTADAASTTGDPGAIASASRASNGVSGGPYARTLRTEHPLVTTMGTDAPHGAQFVRQTAAKAMPDLYIEAQLNVVRRTQILLRDAPTTCSPEPEGGARTAAGERVGARRPLGTFQVIGPSVPSPPLTVPWRHSVSCRRHTLSTRARSFR